MKWPKKIGTTFMEQIIKRSKLIPGCQKYCKIDDWAALGKTGKFSKMKNLTYVDKIFKLPKRPGPGTYNNEIKFKIIGNSKV